MSDVFSYDHARTPRGGGKVDDALHEAALDLAAQTRAALKRAAVAWGEGCFARPRSSRFKDPNGITLFAKVEHMRPETTMQSPTQLQPS